MSSPMTLGQAHPTSKRDDNAIKSPVSCPPAASDPVSESDTQFSLYPRRLTARLALQTGKGKDAKDFKDQREAQGPQDPKDFREPRTLASPLSPSLPPTTTLDPLGTQIFLRTNSASGNDSLAARLRGSVSEDLAGHDAEAPSRSGLAELARERRPSRGTSFFSRLTMRSKKNEDHEDCDSDLADSRTDISSFPATTSVTSDSAGFIPLHKEPPRYIRSKPCNTKQRHFHRLFLAQELMGAKPPGEHEQPQGRMPATAVGTKLLKAGDAIWAAEFSNDGQYLAVAGKDQVVRVFAVIATQEERKQEEEDRVADKEGSCRGKERLDAPVFRSKPVREFKAHTNEVLALCWSKNNFLLSASMDKTVHLWHLTREESLATFTHDDLVTSIAFHPTDDRFFLSGSLDGYLRLWSIPDKKVVYCATTHEFITAVAFSPDGKTAICGVLSGMCWFYDTEGLKYQFKIHVRSSRGKNAKGSKITGIKTIAPAPDLQRGDARVMISSNDSRIRIYNLKTRMMEVKLKGLENQCSQIHARFSDDGAYAISGSEDRRAYIWNMKDVDSELKDRQPYETFDAHPEVVTTALMAPTRTRQILSASGDPIYDLCNPPPVHLRSLEEAAVSQITLSEYGQGEPSKPSGASAHSSIKKPEESPAYQKRCHHPDGNIIVTTDRTGTIKIFRQDCAFQKRQQSQWDMSSRFSRVSGIGRSGSIMTRASGGGSTRTSLNLNMTQAHHPSDRIMSWRQDVDQGPDRGSTTICRGDQSAQNRKSVQSATPARPVSPAESSEIEKQSAEAASPASPAQSARLGAANPASPSSSVRTRQSVTFGKEYSYDHSHGPSYPPTPSFSLITAADSEDQEKGDWSFWNFGRWGGGLSKLRYSMSSPGSPIEEGPGTESDGQHLSPSGFKPKPKPTDYRRSMGATDLRRLRMADDENRRRSHIPMVTPRSFTEVPAGAVTLPDDKISMADRDPLTLKKRTDSGLGRLSAESKELH